jgi:hypothetical protein
VITEIAFPRGTGLLQKRNLDSGYYNFQKMGQSRLLWFKHFPFFWTILKRVPPNWLIWTEPQAAVVLSWELENKAPTKDILSHKDSSSHNIVIQQQISSSPDPLEKTFNRIWEEATSLVGAGA